MAWLELTLSTSQTLFTTAQLRWKPLVAGEPEGPQIATLWGDPEEGSFGALVRPQGEEQVCTLIRREDGSGRVPSKLPEERALAPIVDTGGTKVGTAPQTRLSRT